MPSQAAVAGYLLGRAPDPEARKRMGFYDSLAPAMRRRIADDPYPVNAELVGWLMASHGLTEAEVRHNWPEIQRVSVVIEANRVDGAQQQPVDLDIRRLG